MKKILLILIASFGLFSCTSNDYLVDGGLSQQNVGTTTYEFLKSNKQLDTLAILIEKAGYLDLVNSKSTTLFAANNLSIRNYVNSVLREMQKFDPEAKFNINDIPVDSLKFMLGGYIFNKTIDRSNMVKQGKIYTAYNGEERLISLRPTDAYSGQLDAFPEYVYFTYKIGDEWDPVDERDDDIENTIRTSNLMSTNGVIHVIQGTHIFSNYISED